MRGIRRNVGFGLVLAACALVIVLSTLYRAEAQSRLADVVRENCETIEELKAAEREEAIERYRDLGRTLRLLKLERTPEIEAVARENRDETLERFAPKNCT